MRPPKSLRSLPFRTPTTGVWQESPISPRLELNRPGGFKPRSQFYTKPWGMSRGFIGFRCLIISIMFTLSEGIAWGKGMDWGKRG